LDVLQKDILLGKRAELALNQDQSLICEYDGPFQKNIIGESLYLASPKLSDNALVFQ
jgi:hypothetical protein